jgi:hypothetical protein
MGLRVLLCVVCLVGCVQSAAVTCSDGRVCPPELAPNSTTAPTNYVLHDTVSGAKATYSPGSRITGASF